MRAASFNGKLIQNGVNCLEVAGALRKQPKQKHPCTSQRFQKRPCLLKSICFAVQGLTLSLRSNFRVRCIWSGSLIHYRWPLLYRSRSEFVILGDIAPCAHIYNLAHLLRLLPQLSCAFICHSYGRVEWFTCPPNISVRNMKIIVCKTIHAIIYAEIFAEYLSIQIANYNR